MQTAHLIYPQRHQRRLPPRHPTPQCQVHPKYLMPNPTTLKGHMKCPCKGLWSTTPKPTRPSLPCLPSNDHPFIPGLIPDDSDKDDEDEPRPTFIDDINDESIAMYFVLVPLPTKTLVSSTTTAPVTFPLCCLMATYVFL